MPADPSLIEWMRQKLADAEKALRFRERSEEVWRSGTNETWAEVARLSGGKPLSKKQRLETAAAQQRIAVKCRHEVAMFKLALSALEAGPVALIDRAGEV